MTLTELKKQLEELEKKGYGNHGVYFTHDFISSPISEVIIKSYTGITLIQLKSKY